MIIYHGSAIEVPKPDIYHLRDNVDFGKGFYVTPIREQAKKWAQRFKRNNGNGRISIYELDLKRCKEIFYVKEFNGYTEEWLEYISMCIRNQELINRYLSYKESEEI